MLGRQLSLDGGEHASLEHVGRDSFYGFLAVHRKELFSDEDFAPQGVEARSSPKRTS